jgi:hypothetical protein
MRHGMDYPLENALFQWETGIERLRGPRGRTAEADVVVDAVRDELRRRLGATFRAAELAAVYGEGTDWVRHIPGVDPAMPDLQEVTDAAFWLHLQSAGDFAGGRCIEIED